MPWIQTEDVNQILHMFAKIVHSTWSPRNAQTPNDVFANTTLLFNRDVAQIIISKLVALWFLCIPLVHVYPVISHFLRPAILRLRSMELSAVTTTTWETFHYTDYLHYSGYRPRDLTDIDSFQSYDSHILFDATTTCQANSARTLTILHCCTFSLYVYLVITE